MSGRSLRVGVSGVVALVALLNPACSVRPSGYQYVRDRGTGTYFKVPADWKIFDKAALLPPDAAKTEADRARAEKVPFLATFDAAPKPDKARFDALATAVAPAGLAKVIFLTAEERDGASKGDLRSQVFSGFDDALQAGGIQVSKIEDVVSADHFRGTHMVFTVLATDTTPEVIVDQTAMFDEKTSRLYVFAVGCESHCFTQNKKVIETVVSSLTLKEN